jgi:hypothetical protein
MASGGFLMGVRHRVSGGVTREVAADQPVCYPNGSASEWRVVVLVGWLAFGGVRREHCRQQCPSPARYFYPVNSQSGSRANATFLLTIRSLFAMFRVSSAGCGAAGTSKMGKLPETA